MYLRICSRIVFSEKVTFFREVKGEQHPKPKLSMFQNGANVLSKLSEKLKNCIKIISIGQAVLELLIKKAKNILLINNSRTT